MDDNIMRHEAAGGPLIDGIAAWLLDEAMRETEIPALLEGCCARLHAAGVPLWRVHVSYSTLHPLYIAQGVTWTAATGLEVEDYHHRAVEPEQWLKSPLYHMVANRIELLRRPLTGPDALVDFEILEEFQAQGATDYLAFGISFEPGRREDEGMTGSWATTRPGGFSDTHIAALTKIQRTLGVACKMSARTQIARNVATAYLGTTAGLKVLDGRIQRGDLETIHAVVWLSDMRDSTEAAETLSPEDYIARLNAHFEATAGPLIEHGGEVLSFLGDGVLGILPVGPEGLDEAAACARAVAAAREAAAQGRAGAPSFGLALHLGDVMFGNIGVPERLSFSVIGPAVNVAARLQALTKELDRSVLASAPVARAADGPWEAIGARALRGVGREIEVFALTGDR